MSRVLTHREIIPRRPDCLADETVRGEPVSPCYPLLSPVIFTKTGDFPWSSGQYVSLSVVFSVAYDLQGHRLFLRKTGVFYNGSGTLDWVTGENSKRLREQQLRSSPFLSRALRSATAQGTLGYRSLYSIKGSPPYSIKGSPGSKRRSASFQNQGFLNANSARDTLFRVSALPREWQWQRM